MEATSARQLRTVARIGEGAFGEVFLCSPTEACDRLVALKKVDTTRLQSADQVEQLKVEVSALETASECRFVVGFEWAQQTPRHVYMCTEYCPGGDLFTLTMNNALDHASCTMLVAQIAMALNSLHRKNIVYHDLKPENVALSRTGHVRLLDFGLATILGEEHRNQASGRLEARSGGGTLAYTAPEVLQRVPHGCEADWWSLGVVAHELFTGDLPFHSDDRDALCMLICRQPLDLSAYFDGDEAESPTVSFLTGLLQRNRSMRLGYELEHFEDDILGHELFDSLDWEAIEDETKRLHYAPQLSGPLDLSNFGGPPAQPAAEQR